MILGSKQKIRGQQNFSVTDHCCFLLHALYTLPGHQTISFTFFWYQFGSPVFLTRWAISIDVSNFYSCCYQQDALCLLSASINHMMYLCIESFYCLAKNEKKSFFCYLLSGIQQTVCYTLITSVLKQTVSRKVWWISCGAYRLICELYSLSVGWEWQKYLANYPCSYIGSAIHLGSYVGQRWIM